MATLSVLYVARNEQELLPKSIESIRGIADEIVVVNSSSVDGTVAAAKRARARVFSHAWVHDFSKTKNFGISNCTCDWVLCLDADEVLDPRSASRVRSAIDQARPNVSAFDVRVVDRDGMWPEAPEFESQFSRTPQTRIFRRSPKFFFQGRVMESVAASVRKAGGAIDLLDATVHHYLWRGKGEEYAKLRVAYYNKLGAGLPTDEGMPDQVLPRGEEPAPRDPPAVGIVVVGHNAVNHTKQCLHSLVKNTSVGYSLHLVDNGSRDGTREAMREYLGRDPIVMRRNEGVSRGRNAGAAEALALDPRFLCFLDNDTRVPPGWLGEMLGVMERNPDVALLGPVTGAASGSQNVSDRYPSRSWEDVQPLARERDPELLRAEEIDRFCMLVRAEAVRKVGLFDERIGLYGFEERDFCKRVRLAGLGIGIANRVFVEHRGRTTTSTVPGDWNSVLMASMSNYRQKWREPATPKNIHLPSAKQVTISAAKPGGMPRPRTSVVVLTHNRLDVTRPCLESILECTNDVELIVVDNNSTDGTRGYLSSLGGRARVILSDRNLGVPAGRNVGIRESNCEFIVLMDNDVVVRRGWLEEMFDAMRSNDADVVGIEGWQLDKNHAACHKCVNPSERVDYLGGACCLFRRRIFEVAGLLDEKFGFAYYEDVDESIRAKRCGFKLLWHPTPKISHKEHATLIHGQKDFSYQEALSKSYDRFARKMRGEIADEPELLPMVARKLRVLYLGSRWDYGVEERGPSYEEEHFRPSLEAWRRSGGVRHFDFVALGRQHGVPRMSDMLCQAAEEFRADVVFGVFFDANHDPRREVLAKIGRTMPCKTVGWFGDSRLRYEVFDRPWADYLDFCVTTSAEAHEWYLRDGLRDKVVKSQWFASPGHRKMDLPLDVDVSFVGQPHGERRQVIEGLRAAGLTVDCFGTGWDRRLSFDEMIRMFNRSKVNVNLSNASDAGRAEIKGRNFEVPACGGFLLTGVAENLGDYYDLGREVATYEGAGDLVEKVRFYLGNEKLRREIAAAGHARAIRDHTYRQRLDAIFARVGI